MLDWLNTHSNLITAGVQILTAAVWVVYLQIFIVSYRRQKRSNILINRVAGNHDRAHLLVGNMGAEPIYISAVLVEPKIGGRTYSAVVTETLFEDDADAEDTAISTSRQGPLKSAQTRDIGALGDLLDRALADIGEDAKAHDVEEVRITVAAEGTYDRHVVAGSQGYWIHHGSDRRRFLPQENQTRQIRAKRDRRALSRQLDEAMREEADAVRQRVDGTAETADRGDRAAA